MRFEVMEMNGFYFVVDTHTGQFKTNGTFNIDEAKAVAYDLEHSEEMLMDTLTMAFGKTAIQTKKLKKKKSKKEYEEEKKEEDMYKRFDNFGFKK